jgi:hypothetical protein
MLRPSMPVLAASQWLLLVGLTFSGTALCQYASAPSYPSPSPSATSERGLVELTGFAGYQVSTDAGTPRGTLIINGSGDYGGAIDYHVRPGYTAELLYIFVPTHARFASFTSLVPNSDSTSVGLHYIQLGGSAGRRVGRFEPFAALTAGLVIIAPSELKFTDGTSYQGEDVVRFAFSVGAGVKIWITDSLGLRFEARALVPVYFTQSAFWVGNGSSGVGVSGGIPFAQFDFTGGIAFRF